MYLAINKFIMYTVLLRGDLNFCFKMLKFQIFISNFKYNYKVMNIILFK